MLCVSGFAVIAAAYQLTHDYVDANDLPTGSPSTVWHRHIGPRQRHEGTCGCACTVRRSYLSAALPLLEEADNMLLARA